MKSPLKKRLLREFKGEIGKYLVIFILMVLTIGFVSGFLVADGSMIIAYNEGFQKYNIENGHFRTKEKLNRSAKESIEAYGIKIYDHYYVEEELDNDSTMRIYPKRSEVDLECLMQGEFPQNDGEIAIDRMYADNNNLQVGDELTNVDHTWKITGLVALSDYSCLFSSNNDSMFDSVKFGVGIVTPEEFDSYDKRKLKYNYAWRYLDEPADELEEKEVSEDLMENIGRETVLEEFVPRYQNQAINFTGEDMGSDKAMMIILLYIIIAIMAFVFAVTTGNTISKEANVIGTLRASGYTRRELIRHYMSMPVLVTAIGAVIGNILGYTVFKNVCAGMYYGSYSLPTYVTVWSGEAFLITTVVPLLMMIVINYMILWYKLKLSPLKFLRRDLARRKQKYAFPLPEKLGFFHRFRFRVILQNTSNYLVLFIGIVFANLLLMFGILLPSVLSHYQTEMEHGMLSNYQYMLQIPISATSSDSEFEKYLSLLLFARSVETENEDAEKFSAYSLNTLPGKYKSEEIVLYGIEDDSRYVDADLADDGVCISSGLAAKFKLEPGDTLTLREKYEDKTYEFQVSGIYDYVGALSIFMKKDMLNETFDLGDEYFGGYFSDTEITDISKEYIGSVIDIDDLTKISRQLGVSMGSMMNLVKAFAVLIFIVIIYLLSKIIIEKNAQSISMAKILGYTGREISKLYIFSTMIVVIACILISLPIETSVMNILFVEMMMSSISGWIPLYINPMIYIEITVIGIAAYMAVMILEYHKIRKIPMDEALKNVE